MTSAGFAELILRPVADVVRCYTTEYDGSIADNLPEVPTRSFAIFEGVRAIGKIMGKM